MSVSNGFVTITDELPKCALFEDVDEDEDDEDDEDDDDEDAEEDNG